MRIGKIQQQVLSNIDTFQEFELIEYIRGKSAKVKLKCKKCGYEFERYAHHFNSYPHLCPNCNPKSSKNKITLEEAQKRVDNQYNGKLKLLDYKGNNQKIKVKCLQCGKIFESVPSSLWRGRVKGCPYCTDKESKGEKEVRQYLEKNKIQYIQQYRFKDCKDKLMLPFDFYLPQKKILIEYQGEQHYKDRSLYYDESLIKHDKINELYCKEKNIKLIQIPYWKDVNSYLDSEIK